MSIKSKIKYRQFKLRSEGVLDEMQNLINLVSQKGNKSEECQHMALQLALNNFEQTVNGTTDKDFE